MNGSSVLVLKAYAKAHGVTGRAVLAYAVVWTFITLASRFSVSALGLQFGPPGSATLDTVAMLLMLVPAAVVCRCFASRAPSLEQTRSRHRLPSQLYWAAALATGAATSPVLLLPFLHWSIDPTAFLAEWCLILGVGLMLAAILPTSVAAIGSFAALAIFSTPGFVPWTANIVYNVELKAWSAGLGTTLLVLAISLASISNRAFLTQRLTER